MSNRMHNLKRLLFGDVVQESKDDEHSEYYVKAEYLDGAPAGTLFVSLYDYFDENSNTNVYGADWCMDQISRDGTEYRRLPSHDLKYGTDHDKIIEKAKTACVKLMFKKNIRDADWEPLTKEDRDVIVSGE